jgi:predicted N-acetyltransferase YhbS
VNGYRLCLSLEVFDDLYLASEDDDEVVGAVAFSEKDLPGLDLPYLSVAPQELDLVICQRRKG